MSRRGDQRMILAILCVVGALARILTAYLLPNVAHPDETFQYLEQAYRLSTGQGLVPWEYVVGARTWLLAGLIAPVMKAGVMLSPQPAVHLWAVTLFMIGLATAAIAAAFALGARAGGTTHGFCAGLLAAVWSELVYLSPHVLADTVSAVPLIAAFAVAYRIEAPSRRRMAWAGVLFGLAFVVRIQLAPAIGLAMLGICRLDIKSRYLPMGLGFLGPLVLMGVVDWITWGAPFRSVYVYLAVNAGGVADTFGTSPVFTYVGDELRIWGPFTPLVLATAWFGGRKLPLVAAEVVAIVVTFSLIGHKEYRFVYPALPLLFVLCGVGTAELVGRVADGLARAGRAPRHGLILATASAVWCVAALASGAREPLRDSWREGSDWLAGLRRVNADPAACGVGIGLTISDAWSATGQVRLRPDIPLYAAQESTAAYNYLFASDPKDLRVPGIEVFHRVACDDGPGGLCVYARPGRCNAAQGQRLVATPDPAVTRVLRQHGFLPD